MKGEIIYKILDFLEDTSMNSVNFFAAFIKAGYGATHGKIDREYKNMEKNTLAPHRAGKSGNLQKYISKLKSQGLIAESSSNQDYIIEKRRGKTRDT